MKITRKEKLLLALMLAGGLAVAGTGAARAADDDEENPLQITTNLIDPSNVTTNSDGSVSLGNPLGTVTTTVTVEAPTASGSGDTGSSTEKTAYSNNYSDTTNNSSYTITYTPAGTTDSSGGTTTADSYTFTVKDSSGTEKTYTYTAAGTDASGNATAASFTYNNGTTEKSYTYYPGATVSVDPAITSTDASTGATTSGLTYGTGEGRVYYAWTTDGFVQLTANTTAQGTTYTYTNSSGVQQTVEAPDITVNYTGDWNTDDATSHVANTDYTGTTVVAGGNSGNQNNGLVINTSTSSTNSTITDNFIGNSATPSTQAIVGVLVNLNTSTDTATTNTVEITSVEGNFIGNTISSTTGTAAGGAILNQVGTESPLTAGGSAIIESITGSFIGNSAVNTNAEQDTQAGGGGTGGAMTAASDGPGYMARGGAIQNNLYDSVMYTDGTSASATIGTITGDFIGNYATSTWGLAQGGAIFNYAYIHLGEDSDVPDTVATASIGEINGNFINNYVEGASYANGGAIYNSAEGSCEAIIGTINGDFIGNYAYSTETEASGGAIFNVARSSSTAQITSITGSFIGNSASTATGSTEGAQGGAIFNTTQYGTAVIGTIAESASDDGETRLQNATAIQGDFIGNSVVAESGDAGGGAIANWVDTSADGSTAEMESAAIGNIVMGSYGFMYNSAVASNGEAAGGAIENRSQGTYGIAEIENIQADFIGNYASATNGNAYGGAIQNRSDNADSTTNIASIESITGNFIGNYATASGTVDGDGASAFGGAINNYLLASAENLSAIIGTISDSNFIGNYVTSGQGAARGGAISNGYDQTSIGHSLIASIDGCTFIGNYATAETVSDGSYGGAIYNTGTIGGTADYTEVYVYHFYTTTTTTTQDGDRIVETTVTTRFVEGDKIDDARAFYAVDSDTGEQTGAYIVAGTYEVAGSTYAYAYYGSDSQNQPTGYFDADGNYTLAGGGTESEGTITGELTHHFEVAVNTDETGKLGIINTYFIANEATRGGAIYNGSEKLLAEETGSDSDTISVISSISGCYFISNIADKYGGAIYNYSDGVINSITSSYFDSNQALDGNGGAIENAEAASLIGEISGNYFYGNVAGGEHGGGAIYNEGIIESFSGNTFDSNKSDTFGGAIYNNGGTIGGSAGADESEGEGQGGDSGDTGITITATGISGNVFSGNESARGGAIYNTVTRSIISEGGTNYAYTGDNHETFDLAGTDSTGTIMSITGNSFMNNIADSFGGAIYNYHGCNIGEISSNYFYGNESHGGNGGAVENAEFDTSIGTMSGNAFVSNVSYGNGGAIYNQGTIGIEAESTEGGNQGTSNEGGITGSIFSKNEAANGGAIYNNIGTSTVYFYDTDPTTGSIDGSSRVTSAQTTTDDDGNTLYLYTVDIAGAGQIGNISGNYFSENTAVGHGSGEVTQNSNGTYSITRGGNAQGGAIYNAAGSVTLSDGNSQSYTCFIESITSSAFYGNSAVASSTTYIDSDGETVTEAGNAQGGAIYNAGTIGSIETTGDVSVTVTVTVGGTTSTATGTATAGFSGNYAKTTTDSGSAQGGAIYNSGTIGEADEDYTSGKATGITTAVLSSNYAESTYGAAEGGAIYNSGIIGEITIGTTSTTTTAVLSGNYATGATSAAGGAIYNASSDDSSEAFISSINVTGAITSNKATSTSDAAQGGAIYNSGTIGAVDGNWDSGKATGITTAVLSSNYASSQNGAAAGGAIYNSETGTIGMIEITSDVTNNYATGATSAAGGAIYNAGAIGIEAPADGDGDTFGYGGTISITGAVSGNYAKASTGGAYGGAIYNTGTIGVVIETEVAGETTTTITGGTISVTSLTSNYAQGVSESAGGAIYNTDANATINVTGSIQNNYASATSGTAQGGAIYTTGDVNITAENATIVISGNYATSGSTKDENAIYMAADETTGNNGSTLTFKLSGGSSIILSDNIQGETGSDGTGYNVVIEGNADDGVNSGTFYLLNDVNAVSETSKTSIKPYAADDNTNNADLSVGNVTLSTINDEIHTYYTNSFTMTNDFTMVADVGLQTQTMDHFETNNHDEGGTYGEGTSSYTLNVAGMNLTSDVENGTTSAAVYFAEPGLMQYVTAGSGTSELPNNSYQTTAYSPIYKYNVYYVYKDSDSGKIYYGDQDYDIEDADSGKVITSADEDGGYFVFSENGTPIDNNPTSGGGDDSLDSYNPAVLASEVAMAGAYGAMNLMFEYNFEHSDYYMKLPEEVRLAKQEEEPQETDPTKPAYYNQHELTYNGAWTRAFASNESVDYQDGFSSRDKYYGAMFGFDTKVHEHDNGWASVFTGYVGSMGIRQQYEGGHIKQHGGFLGATASFYKKNFYTAWTIAGGTMKAHEHTMYGKDKERLDSYGVAGRIGYNIRLGDEGKFTLLPTFTASYSYINPEDYTNAAGVKFDGSGFSAVQLNPNIKLIWNRDDGWYPYLTVGEVWTVGESSHVRATWAGQSHNLTALDLDTYTEYGIGVQKRWAYERDAYVQVLGHSHGRDGILINAGIRWNF